MCAKYDRFALKYRLFQSILIVSQVRMQVPVSIIGIASVGKTSILTRFMSDEFDTCVQPTIVSACVKKELQLPGGTVEFAISDTAGQERFRSLAPIYLRNAKVVIIVAACDRLSSFQAFQELKKLVEDSAPSEARIYVAINKADLAEDEREVGNEQAMDLTREAFGDTTFYLVSAKTGMNVYELFANIGHDFLEAGVATEPEVTIVERSEEKRCC